MRHREEDLQDDDEERRLRECGHITPRMCVALDKPMVDNVAREAHLKNRIGEREELCRCRSSVVERPLSVL